MVSCGMVRGHNEQMRALDQAVPENAGCIVVQYIRNINGARQLQHRLEGRLNKTVLLRPIGPVLAINLGVDMIGVAWGFRGRAALEAAGAPLVADTPEQLLDMLQ